MSDKSQKTEKPTPKKKREAQKQGQVAKSPELVMWVQILATTYLLPGTLKSSFQVIQKTLVGLERAASSVDAGVALRLLGDALLGSTIAIAPLVIGMVVLGIVGNIAQVGLRATPALLKPKPSRLNPFKGIKRLFSPQSLWDGLKVVLKVVVLVVVAWPTLNSVSTQIIAMDNPTVDMVLPLVGKATIIIWRNAAWMGLVLAAIDYAIQKRQVMKGMKMSKQEIKDENRMSEGDPMVKAEIKNRQQQLSRNRMISTVAGANVVIVNPTHVAVAITYDPAKQAPRVVAKGVGVIAGKIREQAELHNVPIVHEPPLARALNSSCELGQEIPPELYEAVAQVLAFVFALGTSKDFKSIFELPAHLKPKTDLAQVMAGKADRKMSPGG